MICIFKCPSCGDQMKYSIEKQMLVCGTCGSEMKVSEYDIESVSYEGGVKMGEGVNQYQCPSCNAIVFTQDYSAKMKCAYCMTELAAFGNGEGELSPEKVIPFKIDEKGARNAFYRWWMSKETMPEYVEEKMKPEFHHIYVPVWLVDAEVTSVVSARVEKEYRSENPGRIENMSDFSRIYKEELKRSAAELNPFVTRIIKTHFDRIPNNASTNFSMERFHGIEPYDYKELEDFTAAYLSGHNAERYCFEPKDVMSASLARAEKFGVQQCKKQVMAYAGLGAKTSVMATGSDAKPEEVLYALVPVWICNYHYKGRRHLVYINGQTGKADGTILVESGKEGRETAGVFAANLVLWYAVALLVLMLLDIGSRFNIFVVPTAFFSMIVSLSEYSGKKFNKNAVKMNSQKGLFGEEEIEFRRKLKLDVKRNIILRFIVGILIFCADIMIYSGLAAVFPKLLSNNNAFAILLGVIASAIMSCLFMMKRKKELLVKEEVEYSDYLEPCGTEVLRES